MANDAPGYAPWSIKRKSFLKFTNRRIINELETSGVLLNSTEAVNKDLIKKFCDAQLIRQSQSEMEGLLGGLIFKAHGKDGVSATLAQSVANTVAEALVDKFAEAPDSSPKLTPTDMEALANAFTRTKYVGNAHDKFEQYLRRCWRVYSHTPHSVMAPYVSLVQSSGFGKSRMLYELARNAKGDEEQHGLDSSMKVLYTCVRMHSSTGFPEATTKLRTWLFGNESTADQIAQRLKVIYNYAVNHWTSVQGEWTDLFTDVKAEERIKKGFTSRRRRSSANASQDNQQGTEEKLVVVVFDETRALLAEKEGQLSKFRKLRRALVSVNTAISSGGGIFGVLVDTTSTISDLAPPSCLDHSCRGSDGEELALFPPFVLTHTMDAKWREFYEEKTRINDHPDEEKKEDNDELVDRAQMPCAAAYRSAVTGIWGEDAAWSALMRMGRPLWANTILKTAKPDKGLLTRLAANKLMLGLKPGVKGNYDAKNMFGVASMICRVGARPYSTSPLASQAVANFMAILAYVNYERDGYVCSYASDPVLTIGAIEVWHQWKESLAEYILPQLRKLILDEVLDTGGIGELVARIVLLLAMDKCVLGEKHVTKCDLTGQFVSVEAFLDVLGGNGLSIFRKKFANGNQDQGVFDTWKSQWKGWRVGFTHFVQLQLEPNEDTLWYLLGRRAAGIFPRNQYGADLLIPIFEEKTPNEWQKKVDKQDTLDGVSLMLVQVKNRSPKDGGFSKAATKKLCPWFVLGGKSTKTKESTEDLPNENSSEKSLCESLDEGNVVGGKQTEGPIENPLSKKCVDKVIRIYMNMGEEAVNEDRFRFIYSTSLPDNSPKKEGSAESDGVELERESATTVDASAKKTHNGRLFTYCFRSMCTRTYSFLDEQVANRLANMVASTWDAAALVDEDLERRDATEESLQHTAVLSEARTSAELKEMARQGIANAPGHIRNATPSDAAPVTKEKNDSSKQQTTSSGHDKKRVREQGGGGSSKKQRTKEREGEQGGGAAKHPGA